MNDPHLICAGCELAEATTQQPFCDACRARLAAAGLLPEAHSTEPVKVQIGPTDI
ncbi:MAG: hypothetical protein KF740_19880 [Ramlibacter sp.]|nr:hypothetical protein [Ramlibacter sp.]MBX3660701.1 hypothetical protein [Ramlibacter sp.]